MTKTIEELGLTIKGTQTEGNVTKLVLDLRKLNGAAAPDRFLRNNYEWSLSGINPKLGEAYYKLTQ